MWMSSAAEAAPARPPAAAPLEPVVPLADVLLSQLASRPVVAAPAASAMLPVRTLLLPVSGNSDWSSAGLIGFFLSSLMLVPSHRGFGSRRSGASLAGTGCCRFARLGQYRKRDGLAGRLAPLALEPALDLDRALPVVVVQLLAVQA